MMSHSSLHSYLLILTPFYMIADPSQKKFSNMPRFDTFCIKCLGDHLTSLFQGPIMYLWLFKYEALCDHSLSLLFFLGCSLSLAFGLFFLLLGRLGYRHCSQRLLVQLEKVYRLREESRNEVIGRYYCRLLLDAEVPETLFGWSTYLSTLDCPAPTHPDN